MRRPSRLDTVPAADRDPTRNCRQERIHQGGLAETGIAAHQNDAAAAAGCVRQRLSEHLQLRGASNEDVVSRDRIAGAQLGNETVTASMHRLDETRLLWIVAQGLAQLGDADLQHRLGDEGVGPHRIQQLRLGEQRVGVTHQHIEQLQRFFAQGDRASVARQLALSRVPKEGSKSKDGHRFLDERDDRTARPRLP